MSKRVINFKSTVKTIEVDGTIYNVATRTGRTESMLKRWREDQHSKSVYENLCELLDVYLGEDARKELTVDGEDTNLDYIDAIVVACHELYGEEMHKAEEAEMLKAKKKIGAITGAVKDVAPLMNIVNKGK